MLKKTGFMFVGVCLLSVMAGCGMFPDVPDIPGIGEGEDVSDTITHDLTIEYDLAVYSVYSSSAGYDDSQEEFISHLKEEGYEGADMDGVDQTFFIQYGDGTSAGGELYEAEDHYLYFYITGEDDSSTIYTVEANKDDYEAYIEGDADEGQLDDDNDNGDNDKVLVPDDDTVSGEELPDLPRYEGAVMVEYNRLTSEEETEILIEYLVEADWETVFNHYQNALDDHWTIDEWQKVEAGDDVGGMFIAYYEDSYGLTMNIVPEDENEEVTRIHIYASEYHD